MTDCNYFLSDDEKIYECQYYLVSEFIQFFFAGFL